MPNKTPTLPIEALQDLIYEAAVLPEQWPVVLDHLAGIAGAEGTVLIAADMQDLRWLTSPALDGLMADFASGGWANTGSRTQKLLGARHAGFIIEEDVYSAEELADDVLIRDFLRPRGLGWGTATAFPLPTGDTLIFSIERRYADGPVPRAATLVLDALRPHLGRAALLSARLRLEQIKAAVDVIEMLGLPAAILTHRMTLQTANALSYRGWCATGATGSRWPILGRMPFWPRRSPPARPVRPARSRSRWMASNRRWWCISSPCAAWRGTSSRAAHCSW